jgi:predicted ATP-dependent serine protease
MKKILTILFSLLYLAVGFVSVYHSIEFFSISNQRWLAVILAIASNYKNFTIAHDTIVFGEVGLTGEVRAVSYIDKRISEAKKLGFKKCLVPTSNLKSLKNIKGIEIIGINTVKEAIEKICGEC